MARPQKTGLDYFPVDTTWERNMLILKAKYQLVGVGCIIEIYSAIYREGYFIPWDDDTKALFMASNAIDADTLDGILSLAMDKDILSREMFDGLGVLTSRGIQKRWVQISKESGRKCIAIAPDMDLISEDMADIPPGNPRETPQSKVKESKGKEIVLGEFQNVSLTQENIDKLIAEYGSVQYSIIIEKLSAFKKSKNKTYSSDMGAIRQWVVDAVKAVKLGEKPLVPGRPDGWNSEHAREHIRAIEEAEPPTDAELAEVEAMKQAALGSKPGALLVAALGKPPQNSP